MTIKEMFRGLTGRTGGQVSASAKDKRRTQPLPLYIGSTPARDGLPKPTAANLRRFAETPIARKAINTVKELKAHMRYLVGSGNAGRVHELAECVERHERYIQRAGGMAAAMAGLLTMVHVAIDYLRLHFTR